MSTKSKNTFNRLFYSGRVSMKAVTAVHPARNEDPFCPDLKGTKALRASRSGHNVSRSFSLILSPSGASNTLDFEAETGGV
jgi:hypothetical protein